MPAERLIRLEYRKFRGIWQGLINWQNCPKPVRLWAVWRTSGGKNLANVKNQSFCRGAASPCPSPFIAVFSAFGPTLNHERHGRAGVSPAMSGASGAPYKAQAAPVPPMRNFSEQVTGKYPGESTGEPVEAGWAKRPDAAPESGAASGQVKWLRAGESAFTAAGPCLPGPDNPWP